MSTASALSRRGFLALDPARPPAPTADHWVRVHRTAMACRFEVVLPGEAIGHLAQAREALDLTDCLEAALTVFRETSAVMEVNRRAAGEAVPVSAPLFRLLQRCQELTARTEGAFDITSTPLSRCWGFLRREGRVPSPAEIDAACSLVGMHHVVLADRTVRFLRDGMALNLGAIGKGYALDRMAAQLRRTGVGDALLSAGSSSILALGGHHEAWPVDLQSRLVARGALARLLLRDAAMSTSGAGEQFVEVDGVRYGHVLDPRTGWPTSGVLSATAVTDRAADADALSTAFLVGGADLAGRYCDAHPETLAVLVLDSDPDRPAVFGRHRGATLKENWS